MVFLSGSALKSMFPLAFFLFLSIPIAPVKAESSDQKPSDRSPSPQPPARLPASYGKLPISFEPNRGQAGKPVQFVARGSRYTLLLEPGEAFMALFPQSQSAGKTAPRHASMVGLKLLGADKEARVAGEDKLPAVSNYLLGNNPNGPPVCPTIAGFATANFIRASIWCTTATRKACLNTTLW